MRLRLRLTATIALVILVCSSTLAGALSAAPEGDDLGVYYGYATKVVDGAVPYRDFAIEYPPGALAAIVPPALGHPTERTYARRFALVTLALFAALIVLLARRPRAAFVVALAPLLLGALVLKRFDTLPALLTLIALQLTVGRRYAWAGAALGLGTAVKLYPILLLPLVVIAGGRRAGARAVGAFVAALVIVVLPSFVIAPHGVIESVRRQVSRHLQIETPLASLALLAHSLGIVKVGVVSEADTYGLGGSSGELLAVLAALAFLGSLGLIWLNAPRLVRSRDGLTLAWAATLCAVVVFGRVLSPQYLIWLLPIVPLVSLRATAWLVAALVATNIWYPAAYNEVVLHMDREDIMLLVLRNMFLVALLASLLVTVEPRLRRRTRKNPAWRGGAFVHHTDRPIRACARLSRSAGLRPTRAPRLTGPPMYGGAAGLASPSSPEFAARSVI